MKKILSVILVIMLFGLAQAEEFDEYYAGLISDMNATQEIQENVYDSIQYFDSILYDSEIDRIEVNPNYGTEESGDFIALVYMTYDLYRPEADKGVIVHNSNIIADAIATDFPEVVEVAVFWDLTGYGLNGKISYTIDEDGYHYSDAMLPKEMLYEAP